MNSICQRHPFNVLGVALSFWNPRGKSNDAFLDVIEETFPGKLLIRKSDAISAFPKPPIYGKPIFEIAPNARAAEDYIALTKELLKRM